MKSEIVYWNLSKELCLQKRHVLDYVFANYDFIFIICLRFSLKKLEKLF